VYHRFDFVSKQCDYTCGYVLCWPSESPPTPLVSIAIPELRALAVRHTGSYRNLGNAWSAAYQYARYKKLKLSRKVHAFEIYRSDPRQTPESELVTDVYLPLK
jgi:effector-binding domain-containing protein